MIGFLRVYSTNCIVFLRDHGKTKRIRLLTSHLHTTRGRVGAKRPSSIGPNRVAEQCPRWNGHLLAMRPHAARCFEAPTRGLQSVLVLYSARRSLSVRRGSGSEPRRHGPEFHSIYHLCKFVGYHHRRLFVSLVLEISFLHSRRALIDFGD